MASLFLEGIFLGERRVIDATGTQLSAAEGFAAVGILPKTIFHSFPIDFSVGLFQHNWIVLLVLLSQYDP